MNEAQVDAFLRQLAQLNAPDLRSLLSEAFGFQSYEGERTINYFDGAEHGLSLTYKADRRDRDPYGVVQELKRGPNLAAADINKLRELYDLLNGPKVQHLDSLFHFSSRRVTGWWRYHDQFQILPPPARAPLPTELLGDWPFLVEARFSSPDQFGLTTRRRMQTRNNLSLLLPTLLIGPIYQPHTYKGLKHWVLSPPDTTASPEMAINVGRVVYAQEYYHADGWAPPVGPELSAVDGIDPAPVAADHDAYYRTSGRSQEDALQVPVVLPELLDNYFALPEDAARQYRRACYWFNLARFFWNYSTSTSFVAYVVAVESLLAEGVPHTCPDCGTPHHPSITRAFREFVKAYVPDPPDREQFYKIRSDIAHGSNLLQFDIREEFGGFFPAEIDLRSKMESLNYVCRIALVNWLMAQTA